MNSPVQKFSEIYLNLKYFEIFFTKLKFIIRNNIFDFQGRNFKVGF